MTPPSLSSGLDGKTMDYADVSNTFVRLADTHFVQRCPLVPETPESPEAPPPPAPTLVINEKDMYVVPRLNLVGEKLLGGNPGCCQALGERSATRSPATVFKSKRRRLCPTGKGKRRRSCDEEENGERKAKKQKQDGESSEVSGDAEATSPSALRGCQSEPGLRPAGRVGAAACWAGRCPAPAGNLCWGRSAAPVLPRAELLPPPLSLRARGTQRLPKRILLRKPNEPFWGSSPSVLWLLSLFPHSLRPTTAFTGKSTSTGSTSIFETRGSSVPWPTAWIRFVEVLGTLLQSLSTSRGELDGCGHGGEVLNPAPGQAGAARVRLLPREELRTEVLPNEGPFPSPADPDQQRNSADDAADERSHHVLQRPVHPAALFQRGRFLPLRNRGVAEALLRSHGSGAGFGSGRRSL